MMTLLLSLSAILAAFAMSGSETQEASTILYRVVNQRSTTEIYGMVAPAHQLWINGEQVPVDAVGGSFCYDTGTMQPARTLVLETLSPCGVLSRTVANLDVTCHVKQAEPWIGRRAEYSRNDSVCL